MLNKPFGLTQKSFQIRPHAIYKKSHPSALYFQTNLTQRQPTSFQKESYPTQTTSFKKPNLTPPHSIYKKNFNFTR